MGTNTEHNQVVTGRASLNDVRGSSSAQMLESLSALMDDEADDLEMRRLVKGVSENPELVDQWRRYHAVRASLRQETHVVPSVDLLRGIKAKLNADEAGAKPARAFGGRFARLIGQGAIAASVAGAVLLGYPLLQSADSGSASEGNALVAEQTEAPAAVDMPVLTGDYTASPLTRTVSLDAAARDRLQQVVYEFSGTPTVVNSTTPVFPAQLVPVESEIQAEQGAE